MKKKSIGKQLMEEAFKKVTRAMAEQIDKEILEELIRNEKKKN